MNLHQLTPHTMPSYIHKIPYVLQSPKELKMFGAVIGGSRRRNVRRIFRLSTLCSPSTTDTQRAA